MFEEEQEEEECTCKGFVPFSFRSTPQIRHTVGSFISGGLFAVGWLFAADGAVVGNTWEGFKSPPWFMYLPGIISTFVLLMMNIVSVNDLHPYSLLFDNTLSQKVRLWLFLSFAIGFGAVISIVWMMVVQYNGMQGMFIWPGLCLVLQNVLIFVSGILFLLARQVNEELENGDEL